MLSSNGIQKKSISYKRKGSNQQHLCCYKWRIPSKLTKSSVQTEGYVNSNMKSFTQSNKNFISEKLFQNYFRKENLGTQIIVG